MASKSNNRTPPALKIGVHVVIKELWDGSWITWPVADPTLISHGVPREALAEQRTFLGTFLARVPPEVLSRFVLPEEVALHEVDAPINREDLPRRTRIKPPLSIACVTIPASKGTWVMILSLDHTFFVARGEDLDEAIKGEAARVSAAEEPDPWDWLRLLPPRHWELRVVEVEIERKEGMLGGRAGSLRKKLAETQARKEAAELLASVSRPLHNDKGRHKAPPIVGREKPLALLGPLLSGKDRLSVLIVGQHLVGKGALVRAWLRQAQQDHKTPRIYATSGAQLIAGMSGLGQWQARVRRVMEAAELLDAILYFEDLGDLFGDSGEGGVDLPGAMKPFLEEGRVRLVGEMTPEALDLFESRHVGFFSNLNRVRVEPMSAAQATAVLEARLEHAAERQPDRPNLSPAALTPLIELVERYLPYQAFPGKAVRLFEELRDTAEKRGANNLGVYPPIDAPQIFEAFSLQTGIPVFLLREDRGLRLDTLEASLRERLIGQSEAVRRVAQVLCVVKARLQPVGRPLATFLFVGPTGVGKTEMARALARLLFGDPTRLVRFDMSEFMDADASERLIRGSHSDEGLLTRRVRQQPFCVVLLDEIEKAHPAVFDLLLQVLDEGRLTDARGRTAHFQNAIIIMTSNLGAAHRRPSIGLGAAPTSDAHHYERQVQAAFRPEFVNRLDRVIAFHTLDLDQIQAVAHIALARLSDRRGFLDAGVTLDVTDEALTHLAREGYNEAYGARALRRHLDTHLIAPLARLLASIGPMKGRQVVARVTTDDLDDRKHSRAQRLAQNTEGKLCFALYRASGRAVRRDLHSTLSISALRRHMADAFEWPTIERVRDRLDFLVAQLSYGEGVSKEKRTSKDIQRLQREHHRLDALWHTAGTLREELEMLDEVSQVALLEGDDPAAFLEDANATWSKLRTSFVPMLLALEDKRNQITLLVQEPDKGRAMDHWLKGLLIDVARRKWHMTVHLDGEPSEPHDEWHDGCRWGPPRQPEYALRTLVMPERPHRNILIKVVGKDAGALLALEAGLHRFHGVHKDVDPTWLRVFCVSPRVAFTKKEWLCAGFIPPAPPNLTELPSHTPIRVHNPRGLTINVEDEQHQFPIKVADYWTHFEEIALAHLSIYEEDDTRDEVRLFEERIKVDPEDDNK